MQSEVCEEAIEVAGVLEKVAPERKMRALKTGEKQGFLTTEAKGNTWTLF